MRNSISLLEPILADPEVMRIAIDGHQRLSVEKKGENIEIPSPFDSDLEVVALIDDLMRIAGQTNPASNPLDLRLSDGTHIRIVMPPIARTGPQVTMRKSLPGEPSIK